MHEHYKDVNWNSVGRCGQLRNNEWLYIIVTDNRWHGCEYLIKNKIPVLAYIGQDGDIYCFVDELVEAGARSISLSPSTQSSTYCPFVYFSSGSQQFEKICDADPADWGCKVVS